MVSFESDYNNGAHPDVLQHLLQTNSKQSTSYGSDEWSRAATEKIKAACRCDEAQVFLLVGGTQTNATVIDGVLTGYEGVLAVTTAHINVHEAGAIEASGHKIITLPSHNGKMSADDLQEFHEQFYADPVHEHCVIPGIVYITLPTELGTLYTAEEIEKLYALCQEFEVPLYIDGARLGYALTADGCDFGLPWLTRHCDVFYIGGTKVGALCGEAVVFTHGNAPRHFFNIIKQHGALLAKSRLAGVQFDALFSPPLSPSLQSSSLPTIGGQEGAPLYFRIARHGVDMAMQLRKIFTEAGLRVLDSTTNQQFVELSNTQIELLRQHVAFETWEPVDDNKTLCRFVTSWATTEDDLTALAKALLSP